MSNIPLGSTPTKQTGVALMIVIMVFALVSILSVGMYNRQGVFIQVAANNLARTQAYEFAISAELYARQQLFKEWDRQKNTGEGEFVDDLNWEGMKNSIVVPFDEAFAEGQYNDIHGKINLNDLVLLSGEKNDLVIDRVKRLINYLDLETIKVDALIGWIDENTEPELIDEVEDGEYLSADTPYRAGNQPLFDISELLLIAGVDKKEYEKLLPFVTVMPRGICHINVNMAPLEVLQSLHPDISKEMAESLVSAREKESWETIEDFKSDSSITGLKDFDSRYLDVNSVLFEIATKITLSDRTVRMLSVVHRSKEDGKITLLKRDQGQKYLITKEKIDIN